MTIYVDGKEPFSIQTLFDEVKHFEYGDIVIEVNDKRFVVERKTLPDFWSSLRKGRLNEQLTGCDALLIHRVNQWEEEHIDWELIYDCINGISKHHIVWWAMNLSHIKILMRRYERQMMEGTFGEFRRILVKNDLPTNVRIMAQFPGIAEDRARLLLKNFKTLKDIFYYVDEFDDCDIPGIGPVTIKGIHDALSEEYKE